MLVVALISFIDATVICSFFGMTVTVEGDFEDCKIGAGLTVVEAVCT